MDPALFYGRNKKKRIDIQSDTSDNNEDITADFGDSSDEYIPSESDSTSISLYTSSNENDVQDNQLPVTPYPSSPLTQWSSNFQQREKLNFTGNSGLKKKIRNGNVIPLDIFQQFFDEEIVNLMVEETNRYAQQYISTHTLRRSSRMNKWVDVTYCEMRKFLGVLLVTGLIQYPNIEDYWRRDSMFYHPMFHQIGMSYNRFSLILKNWHVCNNEAALPHDRLHKVANFIKVLISNIQEVYTPGEKISVDETMISHRGRLIFRQYNPGKAHKYGIKLFKLCEMSGYIWNFSIYCGQGTSDILPGLDHSGSVVISLSEPLLNEGRVLVADNWYSSIPLATFLKNKNTEYCGTMRMNRSGIPNEMKAKKLSKGQLVGAVNNDGIRIIKYQDKKAIYIISTFHGADLTESNKKNRQGEKVKKPTAVLDYNRVKGGIDLSDQMISYYSALVLQ